MTNLELIKEISFKFVGISNISLKTKIGKDLGLDGDDAKEFLELIFAEFNFEGKKFPFEYYFNYENDLWGVKNFFNKIFNPKKYISQKDITIGEIIQFIETNKNEI
ncbi:DUF1493 family protein [Tenacibaculum tangerinum]|uniref:DUF1493 family protein n=1 Tax=Tenacibaculum tangerinum TaxID=3038772 RepID=A0ABY8L396_9FLAO|nr:DUF1493 family protein [Tenacibaculum tangerinum]WGH75911.1 DUF1493 family protein [Tenacibaculum tangerinum]